MSTDTAPLLPTLEQGPTQSDSWLTLSKSKASNIWSRLSRGSKSFTHIATNGIGKVLVYFFVVIALLVLFVKALDVPKLREEFALVPEIRLDSLSLDSISDESLNVNVSGQVIVDYSNIDGFFRRNFVKGCAGVLRKVTVLNTTADIYSREMDESNDGSFSDSKAVTATIPVMDLNIANEKATNFSFVSSLNDFGSASVMSRIVKKFLYDEDMTFRVKSNASAGRFGIYVGPVPIEIEQTIKGSKDDDDNNGDGDEDGDGEGFIGFPSNMITGFNLSSLSLSATDSSHDVDVVVFANVSHQLSLFADIPSLSWIASIDKCGETAGQNSVKLLDLQTGELTIYPSKPLDVEITSKISKLDPELLLPCPDTGKSTLDSFISRYLNNQTNTIRVMGAESQKLPHGIPSWLEKLLSVTEVTFDVPGHSMEGEKTIRDIKFRDFKLEFPESRNPFQKPTGKPKVSAVVTVIAMPPSLITIDNTVDLTVTNAKGNCSLYSDEKKFAEVVLEDWVPCLTSRGASDDSDFPDAYIIEFAIDQIPLEVTDEALFADVMTRVLWTGEADIQIEANVDGEVHMPIGTVVITDIPASGSAVLRPTET